MDSLAKTRDRLWGGSLIEPCAIVPGHVTVFHDISKQIQQRARIGEIFARWHLAIAITSLDS